MIAFEEVTRKKSKARIAVIGPSGSGKTLSSLLLAYGMTNDWKKIALIDTEHERGRFYAERNDFNTGKFLYAPLSPPYSPEKYIDYVNSAAKAVGEDGAVIVDSFSHVWNNEGGILDIKAEIEKRNSQNSFKAWNEAGKIQNNLVNSILSVPCHAIITMRTKMKYVMEVNEYGKNVPTKVGLEPVQRDGTEYEFDIVLQLDPAHSASVFKDTTFLDKWQGVITPDLGEQLADWLNKGAEPERCADCGSLIMPDAKRSITELVKASTAKFGRVLCVPCGKKTAAKSKKAETENAAKTVSA